MLRSTLDHQWTYADTPIGRWMLWRTSEVILDLFPTATVWVSHEDDR